MLARVGTSFPAVNAFAERRKPKPRWGPKMKAKLVAQPTVEPVTVTEFRDQSRLDVISAEDPHLLRIISTARQVAENQTWITIAEATYDAFYQGFPHKFEIPFRPVRSVASITYRDQDGNPQTLNPNTYRVDTVSDPAVVTPVNEWPIAEDEPNSVVLRFVAGYTPSEVPPQIKHAILVLCDHFYQHRGQVGPDRMQEIPFAARALLDNVNMRGV
jgi:uncharacterized phiE125 gp8 family phage protein